ncbi:MAG: hypothetical protein JW818_11755 [Pirellulales bacterium]|nr:hypothetical protein [Pirellulales bacterium]
MPPSSPRSNIYAIHASVILSLVALSATADEKPDHQKEADAIIKMVQDSQRKGVMGRDRKAFLSIWAEDARLISGRSEKPGKYDRVMTRKQLEQCSKITMSGPPRKGRMDFENTRVTIADGKARFTYRCSLSVPDHLDIIDEVFLLRKTKDGWTVYENRCRLVEVHHGSEVTQYTPETWKALDDQVTEARKQGNPRWLIGALLKSRRLPEAYTELKKLTENEPDNAMDWVMRGHTAMSTVHFDDAVASFKKALELNPTAEVPDSIRIKLKAEPQAAEDLDRKKEADAIIKMVQESQRKGVMKRDRKAYMSIWTKDARLICGRGEKPDKYDIVLQLEQIKQRTETTFAVVVPRKGRMTFEDARVTFTDDKAKLTYRTAISQPERLSLADEIFLLRKTKDGWKVYENRCWIVECHDGSDVTQYTPEMWKALDDQVEEYRKQGDPHMFISALCEAFRYAEAYAESKKLTKAHPDDANAWCWRGHTAIAVGKSVDALASYKKALDLDPGASVPEPMREKLKAKPVE